MSMTFKSREDRVATRRRSWVHIPSVATARARMHWSATHSCPCTPGVLGQVCVGGDTLPSEIQLSRGEEGFLKRAKKKKNREDKMI